MTKSNPRSKAALSSKKRNPELRSAAHNFLKAFVAAAASSKEDIVRIFDTGRFSIFEGGAIEFTDDLVLTLNKFVMRAANLLGSKAGNEKALREIALQQGQEFLKQRSDIDNHEKALIDAAFAEAEAEYEFLAPNYVIVFGQGVRSIVIGRVRACITADFAAELTTKTPTSRLKIVSGPEFAVSFSKPNYVVTMPPISWVVRVNCAKDNVEEEAKWLIDVALSFLRLHYKQKTARFPSGGKIEPDPVNQARVDQVGIKFRGLDAHFGGGSVSSAYEVGKEIERITLEPSFRANTRVIFDPPEKSLAERVAQGLGWLTRGRQAEDRAERLLYFFTAIEALLSRSDKTAPVVQTIARHASVLLSADNKDRVALAGHIRRLYVLRSEVVHAGNRSVLWNSANLTQYLAEAIFQYVIQKADLKLQHSTFCDQLAEASYGFTWPLPE